MKTFEEYLREQHAFGYTGLDDEMSDDLDCWISDLDVQDVIDYAEGWGRIQVLEAQIQTLKEIRTKIN